MSFTRSLQPKHLLLASLFWLAALPVQAEIGKPQAPSITVLPDLLLDGGDGVPFTFAKAKGKVVLLDFWATWCAPCVAEMPKLNALQARYKDRGLMIVPASQDMTGMLTVRTFYRQHKLDRLGVYLDKDATAFRTLNLRALPTAFLIGRDGQVLTFVEGGYDWTSGEATGLIEKALATKP